MLIQPIERISVVCFAASYAAAFFLDLVRALWRRPVLRVLSLGFGTAGVLAQTLFLIFQPWSLSSPYGSLVFLAWILAVFYLYGAFHYREVAWGVFVLPLVLVLIGLASSVPAGGTDRPYWLTFTHPLHGEQFWSTLHGALLLLAAVGVCVGCIASVMYLVQAHRLKAKVPPNQGLHVFSLERLEQMNRRAINWAFPLLTAGVAVGVALLAHRSGPFPGWSDMRIVSTGVLWVVFAMLLYLRYGFRLRGRRVALLTITAFALLLFTLASAHTTAPGGGQP